MPTFLLTAEFVVEITVTRLWRKLFMMTGSRSGGRGPYYQLPMEETVRCSQLCRKISAVAHFGGNRLLKHTAKTQYRELEINIPRKVIVCLSPDFHNPHSCVCERSSHHRSSYSSLLLQENM